VGEAYLGLAAEPGGELGVHAGVGRDRDHRARTGSPPLPWLGRPLLSFGADVEVVAPEAVRADLACVAAEVVAAYR
jgi:predicted DNA-binding transcriptional regulator YafY